LNIPAGRNELRKPPEKLRVISRSRLGTYGPGYAAPNKFGSWAGEEKMMNGLILITKLTFGITQPTSLSYYIFSRNSIVPNQREPNLDFQRNFGFSQMFEGSVNTITGQIFINRFYNALFSALSNMCFKNSILY
jgi:hypothetical protein